MVGDSLWQQLPTVDTLLPVLDNTADMILGMNWQPSLCVIGADGLPSVQVWKCTENQYDLKLSFRIPPGVDADSLEPILKETLEENPYGAEVSFSPDSSANGFIPLR